MRNQILLLLGLLFITTTSQAANIGDKVSPIKIGVIIPLSGPRASIGEDAKAGIDLALEDLKLSGEIKENIIELVFEDSQGDPAKGISSYKKLLADGATIIITQNSNISLPIAPLVTNDRVIQIAVTTTSDKYSIPNDNTFRVSGDTTPEANAMVNFIVQRQKNNSGNIAILTMEDEYPQILSSKLKKKLEAQNFPISYHTNFLPKETDFRTIIAKLKAKKIEHILAIGYQTEIGFFVKQSKELNFKPYTILTNSPVNHREFFEIAKESAEEVFCSYFYVNPQSPIAQRYNAKHNKQINYFAANAYDGLKIAAQSLSKCNYQGDVDCLKKALYSVKNFNGASGHKRMDDVFGDMQDEVTIYQARNGKFEPF